MRSLIDIGDAVDNKNRKFGADPTYYAVRVRGKNIQPTDALLSSEQLDVAIKRAKSNREDIPPLGRLERLRDWLAGGL